MKSALKFWTKCAVILAALAFRPLSGGGIAAQAQEAGDLIPVTLKLTLETSHPVLSKELWQPYKDRFITAEGRMVDDGNDGISHSEGQGYGLLLAAFADDQATFQKLWSWTARELFVRGDNLAAWRWRVADMPHVADRNNATDGDLLMAWALSEAAQRWKNPEYRIAAHKIALDIGRLATEQTAQGRVLAPGVAGFGVTDMKDGPVVNLSYWVFPAMEALKYVAPEVDWLSLRQNGLRLIKLSSQNSAGLPPDWLSLQGKPVPAKNFPPQFSYDALRIPLYLAWGSTAEREALGIFAKSWRNVADNHPNIVDLNNGQIVEPFADEGYQAVVAVTRCATEGVKFPAQLLNVKLERYYSSTLHMLSLTLIANRYPKCF